MLKARIPAFFKIFFFCVLLLNLLQFLSGQSSQTKMSVKTLNSEVVRGEMGRALDEYMRRLEAYGFSGSLLVAKNGQIALSKGYGLADRERSIPVTPNTLFEGASLSKQFTAAAIMKLEEQGKLRIEDSIARYFDNVPDDNTEII